jgi:hypothetical protein
MRYDQAVDLIASCCPARWYTILYAVIVLVFFFLYFVNPFDASLLLIASTILTVVFQVSDSRYIEYLRQNDTIDPRTIWFFVILFADTVLFGIFIFYGITGHRVSPSSVSSGLRSCALLLMAFPGVISRFLLLLKSV